MNFVLCILEVISGPLGWVKVMLELMKQFSYLAITPPTSKFEEARNSHEMFHQNAKSLHRQYRIPIADAKGVVCSCPPCSHHGPGLGVGTNPKGLKALQVWQMDVTHVPDFGKLKYVHVTIDTYSHFIWATAQTGQKALHVERHLMSCFAVMGVPVEIKTRQWSSV